MCVGPSATLARVRQKLGWNSTLLTHLRQCCVPICSLGTVRDGISLFIPVSTKQHGHRKRKNIYLGVRLALIQTLTVPPMNSAAFGKSFRTF